jgi:hypothetical protein
VVVGGSSVDELVTRMAGDFEKRRPFSLGMLAAPFVPVASEGRDMSRARNERRVQTTVLAVSEGRVGAQVNELSRVLIRLKLLASDIRATLDVMTSVETDTTTFLVWEAAPEGTGNTVAVDLVDDAASATVTFLDHLRAGLISAVNVVTPDRVSLVGTALLLSGLAASLTVASQPTIVVRSLARWAGSIERV